MAANILQFFQFLGSLPAGSPFGFLHCKTILYLTRSLLNLAIRKDRAAFCCAVRAIIALAPHRLKILSKAGFDIVFCCDAQRGSVLEVNNPGGIG